MSIIVINGAYLRLLGAYSQLLFRLIRKVIVLCRSELNILEGLSACCVMQPQSMVESRMYFMLLVLLICFRRLNVFVLGFFIYFTFLFQRMVDIFS